MNANDHLPVRPLSVGQKIAIATGMVAMGVGFTINFVVVSPLARQAGLSELQVSMILTLSAALYAFTTPAWAKLAERFGRKRIMVFSLFAMAGTNAAFTLALSAALAGMVTGLATLFLFAFVRLFFGLLAPGMNPAAMAAMTDATTPKTRAAGLGMLGAAVGIGSVAGPAGAAILAQYGALAPLWGAIVFAAIAGVIIAFTLPPSRDHREVLDRPKLDIKDKRIRPFLIFLMVYFLAVGAIQQSIAWLIEDRFLVSGEQTVQMTGLVFVSLAIPMIVTQFAYIQPFKPDPRRILPIGLIVIAAGYLGATLLPGYLALNLNFALVGFGGALVVPSVNALGSLAVERSQQGAAAALMAMAPPTGYVAGPLIGAALYEIYPPLPFAASSAVMAVLFVTSLFLMRSTKRADAPSGD